MGENIHANEVAGRSYAVKYMVEIRREILVTITNVSLNLLKNAWFWTKIFDFECVSDETEIKIWMFLTTKIDLLFNLIMIITQRFFKDN